MNGPLRHNAHAITYRAKERMVLFRTLPLSERAAVFNVLSPYVQGAILGRLTNREVIDLIDHMDMERAERALSRLTDKKRRNKIISRMKGELKEKAEYFLRFHPKAAMELLNFNYLLLPETMTIGEAADALDEHYHTSGKFPEVLVHKNGELMGSVALSSLVREDNRHRLGHFVIEMPTITYQADIKDILNLFQKTKHGKLAVLDQDGSVIGIIYSDDALALFGNQPASALYDFAGVADTERAFDSIGSKVRRRYKWLIVNLGTAFLAASVVGLFERTLSEIVLLAIYMPIVAGMGGNAATQTLAVIVRGITVGEVNLKNSMPAIMREIGAGFVNGAINGVIVACIATFWNQSALLGLVIGTAMVINLVIAGFFGALIPLIMKALGKDPATSATIFITTATDVFGFFAFLGLATIVLL